MEDLKPAVRWLKSYWDEEDILFYFEADEDGWVLRQIELQGPNRTPVAASALSEFPDAERDGLDAVRRYVKRYGMPAESPIPSWDPDFPHEEITVEEFEEAWQQARAFLDRTT